MLVRWQPHLSKWSLVSISPEHLNNEEGGGKRFTFDLIKLVKFYVICENYDMNSNVCPYAFKVTIFTNKLPL